MAVVGSGINLNLEIDGQAVFINAYQCNKFNSNGAPCPSIQVSGLFALNDSNGPGASIFSPPMLDYALNLEPVSVCFQGPHIQEKLSTAYIQHLEINILAGEVVSWKATFLGTNINIDTIHNQIARLTVPTYTKLLTWDRCNFISRHNFECQSVNLSVYNDMHLTTDEQYQLKYDFGTQVVSGNIHVYSDLNQGNALPQEREEETVEIKMGDSHWFFPIIYTGCTSSIVNQRHIYRYTFQEV